MSQLLCEYSGGSVPDATWCRLCLNICSEHKILYDKTGRCNEESYGIALKYFHPRFLTVAKGNRLTVLCLNCWCFMSEFSVFQMSTIVAQEKLLRRDDIQFEKFVTKSEEAARDETKTADLIAITSNAANAIIDNELVLMNAADDAEPATCPTVKEPVDESKFTIPGNVIDANKASSSSIHYCPDNEEIALLYRDDSDQLTDEEYDDPVGTFTGGEFNNVDDAISIQENVSRNHENPIDATTNVSAEASQRDEKKMPLDDLISQWRRSLVCTVCKESVATFTLLRRHFRQCHPGERCHIECCRRQFYKKGRIREHITMHVTTSRFKCDMCDNSYSNKTNLRRHMRQKHPNVDDDKEDRTPKTKPKIPKRIQWENKTEKARNHFAAKALRLREQRKQVDEIIAQWWQPLVCRLCHEPLSSFSLLMEHFGKHHATEKCYVECCLRKYANRYQLRDHVQIHLFPNRFQCKSCDTPFTTEEDLETHRSCHSPAPAPANEFNEDLKTRSRNIAASEIEDILAKWKAIVKCVVCTVPFATFTLLRQHFLQHHPNDKLYIYCCEIKHCTQRQIGEHALFHLDPNAFKCQLCGMCLKSSDHLKSHMYYVHSITKYGKEVERKHKCSQCDKAFRTTVELQEHIAKHTGGDLYKCLHCPMTFRSRCRTYCHFKTVHPHEWAERKNVRNFFKSMEIRN